MNRKKKGEQELNGGSERIAEASVVYDRGKNVLIKNKATVESWSIPLNEIYENQAVRLDASHYDRQTKEAIDELKNSGYPLKPLSELADVRLPSQFVRIWAEDEKYGHTYVNATDLMSLTGLGVLSGNPRYLSRETDVDVAELTIREGWLLVTCSGTIGRVFYVSNRIDGWVATHDLIRVIPKQGTPVGFLHAFLSSPTAQKQIAGHTHGGQIDHVTHHQLQTILVPIVSGQVMNQIHERVLAALHLREQAIKDLGDISDDVISTFRN